MATSSSTEWWQRVLTWTSLLANSSNIAAVIDVEPMAAFSLDPPQPQYIPPASIDHGALLLPNIEDPLAIDAQTVCPGYILSRLDTSPSSLTAHLTLAGEPCNLYGDDIHDLDLTVEYQAKSRLHINIKPSYTTAVNESWYALPEHLVPRPSSEHITLDQSDFDFSWTNYPTFGFNITRIATDEIVFSTDGARLVYENQFIEFVTSMDSGYNMYGLGEAFRGLRLQPGLTRTIYAADTADPIDRNMYGSHPFYLETKYYKLDSATGTQRLLTSSDHIDAATRYTSNSHGVYLRNAHAQEILMHDTNTTWRALGGEIDLYFFSGPSQPEVTSQYLHQIGLPAMQQYWTFGYHQCRWGYANWSMTEETVDTFAKFGLPLETIWNDIDYMKGYRDFENDPIRFPYADGARFLSKLHKNGQHYVPIVDAAIYIPNPENVSDAYQIFEDGRDSDCFLKNPDGSLYIGQVWPGYTVFPDWLTSRASAWWQKSVSDWYNKIPFDGLWIDMSEVSSFCVGSCGSGQLERNPVHPWFKIEGEECEVVYDYPEGFNVTNVTAAAVASIASSAQAASCSSTSAPTSTTTNYLRTKPTPGLRNVDHPPYVIDHVHGDLAVHAVAPNATHYNGVQEYDVHSLYGHLLLRNTYSAILNTNPTVRPFIIGRSNFVGSGNYSGHWGGDNRAQFRHMYWSIPQALSFSLFGIPMFGVDTCGFIGNTDEELCNRWMQLSAFFPFYRNHNSIGSLPQEPYQWASVVEATKTAMDIRFQLLPYMYTLFHYAHSRGDTVMRALAWEFPNDPYLIDADRQFFLGPAILVIPVLTQGYTTVDGVFPGLMEGTEVYYDWYNQTSVPGSARKNTTIEAPLGHIPVFIRGGHVLATQAMRMTTRDARKGDWSLIITMNHAGRANGTLYLDDGVSIEPSATKLVTFGAQAAVSEINGQNVTKIRLDVFVEGSYTGLDLPIANITVLGVNAPPAGKDVLINGNVVNGRGTTAAMDYVAENEKIVIRGLRSVLGGHAWRSGWSLTI
ncbi:hypothetical protein LTR05_005871 [Lithohypha guttulata]|uniref:alpha-glucosidase n=1 Tax=Lithohypha guttulata TaxID=1690604 RepID=A0AAN7Y5R5_9EURO|nr:hypothetical protein LTR05_005871 [Lithohypha guttulata]